MAKLPVFATVGRAFSDTFRAARVMPILALAFAILHVAFPLIRGHFGISSSDLAPPAMLLSTALSIAFVVLTAPVDIAFYRFLIMGEAARSYNLDIGDLRFRRYCFWQIVTLVLLLNFIDWTIDFFARDEDVAKLIGALLSTFAWLACYAGLILLFPAIATGVQEATPRNALTSVRGSFWRTVAILFLIWIPLALVSSVLLVANKEVQLVPDPLVNVLASLTDAIFNVAAIAAGAHLFNLLWRPAAPRSSD